MKGRNEMNELVFLKNDQAVTMSLIIAENTNNQHKSVIQLIDDHKARFEPTNLLGGRPTKVAILNEQQATFLITLLRNNDIVLEFKNMCSQTFE